MINSELYLKDQYLNKSIIILPNKVIVEYDLKSANTSLCREYKLLPESQIAEIEVLPKEKRVTTIGKLMRNDSKLKEGLKNSFVDIRKRFFDSNNIVNDDILSIKKDAIFCLKEVQVVDFGACHFVRKNTYTSYMYLNGLEIYYANSIMGGTLIVKGMNDESLKKHNGYMCDFLKTLCRHLEQSSRQTQLGFLKRFVDKYKWRQLDVGYYREFSPSSIIRLGDADETYDNEIFIPYEDKVAHVDINYNFNKILCPLIKNLV